MSTRCASAGVKGQERQTRATSDSPKVLKGDIPKLCDNMVKVQYSKGDADWEHLMDAQEQRLIELGDMTRERRGTDT